MTDPSRAVLAQLSEVAQAAKAYLDYLHDYGRLLGNEEFKLLRARIVTLACKQLHDEQKAVDPGELPVLDILSSHEDVAIAERDANLICGVIISSHLSTSEKTRLCAVVRRYEEGSDE